MHGDARLSPPVLAAPVFDQYQAQDFQQAAVNYEQAQTSLAEQQHQNFYQQNDGTAPTNDFVGW